MRAGADGPLVLFVSFLLGLLSVAILLLRSPVRGAVEAEAEGTELGQRRARVLVVVHAAPFQVPRRAHGALGGDGNGLHLDGGWAVVAARSLGHGRQHGRRDAPLRARGRADAAHGALGGAQGRAGGRAGREGWADGLGLVAGQVPVGRGHDAHALAPGVLLARDGAGLLARPVDGLVRRVEEGGRGPERVVRAALAGGRPAALLIEELDALGDGDVGAGAIELDEEVLQLVVAEVLNEVEDVVHRGPGPVAGLRRHLLCFSGFLWNYFFGACTTLASLLLLCFSFSFFFVFRFLRETRCDGWSLQ